MLAIRSTLAILAQPSLLWAILRLNEVKTVLAYLLGGTLVILFPLWAPKFGALVGGILIFVVSRYLFSSVLRGRSVQLKKCSNLCLTGKTVIVTGGNLGIGFELATEIATLHGAHVIIASRGESTGAAAVEAIANSGGSAEWRQIDLSSPASVCEFWADLVADGVSCDVLINNAGVMFPPFRLTDYGWEEQLSVNHGGHALLTLLLCRSQPAKPAVINLSSVGHLYAAADGVSIRRHQRSDLYDPVYSYASSKLANIAFTKWLAVRGVNSLAVHPGLVDTGLWRHVSEAGSFASRLHAGICRVLMKTPAQASSGICSVMLACQHDRPVSGSYCADGYTSAAARIACDPVKCDEVMRETHAAISTWFRDKARAQLSAQTHALVAQHVVNLLNV